MSYMGAEYTYDTSKTATANLDAFKSVVKEVGKAAFEDDMIGMLSDGKYYLESGGQAYSTIDSAKADGPSALGSVYADTLSGKWAELLSNSRMSGTTAGGFGSAASLTMPTVADYDKANATLKAVQNAINIVSTQRSALGAIQNRLEHTVANLDNVSENTQAAESRIRDTDMAAEMVEYSKNNILAQAGQSMLAQANQSTQGVLSLLQ